MAKVLDDNNFTDETSEGITLVDFYADWCGPCKMLAPTIEELSDELSDVNVVKVDVDNSPKTAMDFGIRSIPTIVLLKDGEEVDRIIGMTQKAQLLNLVKSA